MNGVTAPAVVHPRGAERGSGSAVRGEVVSGSETGSPPEGLPAAIPVTALEAGAAPSFPAQLERRVVALERSVNELRDTRALEERVYQRVVAGLPQASGASAGWLNRLNPFRGGAAPLPVASGWLIMDML